MLALDVAILSERGGRPHNEDACGHWHSQRDLVAVLCDGAGGHGGGDLAAQLGVTHLIHAFASRATTDGEGLGALVRQTNQAVLDARVPGTRSARMHATLVALVIDHANARAHWAHCGDSRLYWFRQAHLLERTLDHSLVQSMVDAGRLDEADLRTHPRRSELRSALGADASLLQVADSGPAREVLAGDAFLLCSDGVWEHVDEILLSELLIRSPTPHAWLAEIEAAVKDATLRLPRHDNFTGLAVWVREGT